ncbi:hypothetical protein [Actinopolymorpha pittospori]|uniref:Cu2+-containing amine oxidase n=1 Tax=Actinopolymorpha pittospori TaxID=648752 RepID=A0A927MXZ6_9ACTN|nr:hypothetical protein [Actinopolymorpha pittospori]MBE1608384.1 Cu2+-containing amine oxidase [Actinopolymorpha pittospori]
MSASFSGAWRRRPLAFAVAVLLACVTVTAALLLNQQGVSGADDGNGSGAFTKVGDGTLPTTRPELGSGRDPLSTDEVGYAIHVATSDASAAGATDVNGTSAPEVLYVDLPEQAVKTKARSALVVLYDYATNSVLNQVVDLAAGKVATSTKGTNLQPPTTSTEADTAIEIAIRSEEALSFKKEFEASEGVPVISADQVEYVAGSWVYDGTTKSGQECGKQRCAQLMVSTASGTYLSTFDFVVNLSTKSVVATK